jgi:hypothetical protein
LSDMALSSCHCTDFGLVGIVFTNLTVLLFLFKGISDSKKLSFVPHVLRPLI